jgi:hypothetical protein
MTYKILSTEQHEETLNVTTEYTFDDGSTSEVVVPIFAPDSLDYINMSLTNRGMSEQAKITRTQQVAAILPQIPVGQVVTI